MGAEKEMRLLSARGSTELGKVASSSAAQGLWLGNRKMGSQVVVEEHKRHPGKETVGEVWGKEDEGKSQQQKEGENTETYSYI